jgi:hypothetical protein
MVETMRTVKIIKENIITVEKILAKQQLTKPRVR